MFYEWLLWVCIALTALGSVMLVQDVVRALREPDDGAHDDNAAAVAEGFAELVAEPAQVQGDGVANTRQTTDPHRDIYAHGAWACPKCEEWISGTAVGDSMDGTIIVPCIVCGTPMNPMRKPDVTDYYGNAVRKH